MTSGSLIAGTIQILVFRVSTPYVSWMVTDVSERTLYHNSHYFVPFNLFKVVLQTGLAGTYCNLEATRPVSVLLLCVQTSPIVLNFWLACQHPPLVKYGKSLQVTLICFSVCGYLCSCRQSRYVGEYCDRGSVAGWCTILQGRRFDSRWGHWNFQLT
jgi:hypothetical protein